MDKTNWITIKEINDLTGCIPLDIPTDDDDLHSDPCNNDEDSKNQHDTSSVPSRI